MLNGSVLILCYYNDFKVIYVLKARGKLACGATTGHVLARFACRTTGAVDCRHLRHSRGVQYAKFVCPDYASGYFHSAFGTKAETTQN